VTLDPVQPVSAAIERTMVTQTDTCGMDRGWPPPPAVVQAAKILCRSAVG
jgi:hypothetical protein